MAGIKDAVLLVLRDAGGPFLQSRAKALFVEKRDREWLWTRRLLRQGLALLRWRKHTPLPRLCSWWRPAGGSQPDNCLVSVTKTGVWATIGDLHLRVKVSQLSTGRNSSRRIFFETATPPLSFRQDHLDHGRTSDGHPGSFWVSRYPPCDALKFKWA